LGQPNLPMTRKLALAISHCLAISVTASAQNVAPVVATPIAPFTVFAGAPARTIDLTTAFSDPDASNAVQLGVSLPSSTGILTIALDGQYKPVTVGNFLNYAKFRAVFRDRRNVVQGGGFIGTVDSAEPAVLVTLPMVNYTAIVRGVGAMPTGLALLEIIRNRSVTLLRQPAQFGRSCGDRGWRRRRAPHQYPVATSARPHFPVSRCHHIGSERDRPSSRPTTS